MKLCYIIITEKLKLETFDCPLLKSKIKIILFLHNAEFSGSSLATGDSLRLLYFTASTTCCNHTCIIQMVSSQH